MRFGTNLLAIVVALPGTAAFASEEVQFAPVPEWVIEREAELPAEVEGDVPVRLILSDTQMRLDPDSQTIFSSMLMKFQTPQGLSAANISLPWRADSDDLIIHRLRILRGDEVIDVLEEGQTFTVLRREESLEQATLDGVLTANMFPDGIEVGDVLDLTYSIRSDHPVLEGHAEAAFGPFNVPADEVALRILWPIDSKMQLTATQGLPEWKRSREGGYQVAEIDLDAVEPLVLPQGAPPRYALVRFVEASDFSEWSDVAHLFAPLYREASQIPAEGPLRREVEKIREASDDPARRAELALALVQDRVRYVALAMGTGGLVPADAATTWSRRYGDCKAKTALLMGILDDLGIEAEPVAVNSTFGDALPNRLPSVAAFDHIIVRAQIGGTEYFLDGTRTGDKALERIAVPYFVWGLPIVEGDTELVPMIPAALALPQEETAIRMDATGGLLTPAPTEIELVLRGDSATGMRAVMTQFVGDSRRKALEDFWKSRYDFITPEKVDAVSDDATGEMRLTVSGTSDLDWDGTWFQTTGMRVGYDADFSRAEGPDSDAPFIVAHPIFTRTTQVVTLPPGFDESAIDGERVERTVAGIEYRRDFSIEGNVFTATRSARSITNEISAAEARAAEKTLADLHDKRLYLKRPQGYRASSSDLKEITANPAGSADDLIDQANLLIDAGKWDDAVSLLNKAIEGDPKNEWAWGNRAIALANKGDYAAAEEAAARTEEINPDNYLIWRTRGLSALKQADYAGAREAFSRAIEKWDEDTWSFNNRIFANLQLQAFDKVLADALRVQEIAPDVLTAYLTEVQALKALGRLDEAREKTESFVKSHAHTPGGQFLASEMYATLGEYDRSDTVLTEAREGELTAPMLLMLAARRDNDQVMLKIEDLSRALEVDPKFVPALVSRAHVYWREYELDKAIADADAAIALDPAAYGAYDVKARALMDDGRTRDAVTLANNLAAALPEDALALATAAQILFQAQHKTKARELLARARKLEPDNDILQLIGENSSVSMEGVGLLWGPLTP